MKKMLNIIILVVLMLGIMSCSLGTKQVLYVFNWTDYIAPELIRKFERQNNCKVIHDFYNSNENMLTKVLTSSNPYDIIVPSGDHVQIMMEMDLLSKIDKTLLNFYHNLDPTILSKSQVYDPTNEFSIPYFWGTTGFIYNTRYLSHEMMADVSWDFIGHEDFYERNVITLLDDYREVIGAALIFNGFDSNDYSDEALEIARETLLRWKPNISQFDSDSFKNDVQDGTIHFGMAYNGDALQVMEENDDIGFTLPREGSVIWVDFLVIPKDSANKELAHKFIDFLLEENNALINTEYVQYATPNIAAFELLDDEIKDNTNIYPTSEYMDKSYMTLNVGYNVLKFDEIWQEIRNK